MLDALFLRHPRSVGESYFEHMKVAFGFAGQLALAAIACAIHGLVPALCERTGSRIVAQLNLAMISNRRRVPSDNGAFDYAI
jgi:hypothetical protein